MSCKKADKFVKDNPSSIKNILEKPVLSVQGYANYKDNSENNKSKGGYYKLKLINLVHLPM